MHFRTLPLKHSRNTYVGTGQLTAALEIQMRSTTQHCPSHATTAARKDTRQTSAGQRTNTNTVEDVLEVDTEDALAEDADLVADVKDAAILRNATRQKWCVLNAETRDITHTNAHRRNKT